MKKMTAAVAAALVLGIAPASAAGSAAKLGKTCLSLEWGTTRNGLTCVQTGEKAYVWAAVGAPKAGTTTTKKPAAAGPAADVTGGACTDNGYGLASLKLTIVNHSSKRSNYIIDVTYYDAENIQIGTGTAYVENLAPGATARDEASGGIGDDSKLSRCGITTVRRSASY